MNPSEMNLYPRISEKAVSDVANANYVFKVPLGSTKQSIAQAIEKQFDVKVGSVRTSVAKGKKIASQQKRRAPKMGSRQNFKKAYIHLSEGEIKIAEVA